MNLDTLPGPVLDRWDWQLAAACRRADVDSQQLFFAPDKEPPSARDARVNRAKAICATCPARQPCRQHALTVGEPFGIWGGLTETERHRHNS